MKIMNTTAVFLTLAMIVGTQAQASNQGIHTEDNEVVCQFNDFLKTKVFIDRDSTLDTKIGVLSTKLIEMPTENARGYNYKLFQVKLVSVSRARCLNCQDSQVIVYKSEGDDEIMRRLDTDGKTATITANVDAKGNPLSPSFVSKGTCRLNEVE